MQSLRCTPETNVTRCSLEKQGRLGGSVGYAVKRLTLDFGSGHELTVHEIEPHVGLCAECGACLGFSLSLSLSAPPLLMHTHTLSLSK